MAQVGERARVHPKALEDMGYKTNLGVSYRGTITAIDEAKNTTTVDLDTPIAGQKVVTVPSEHVAAQSGVPSTQGRNI